MSQSDFTDDSTNRHAHGSGAGAGEFTGAYLVLLDSGGVEAGISALVGGAGRAQVEHFNADDPTAALDSLGAESAVAVFDAFSVAVVVAPPDRCRSLLAAAQASPAVLCVEPERVVYALDQPMYPYGEPPHASSEPVPDYLTGYRDGVEDVIRRVRAHPRTGGPAAPPIDESRATWGLQATRAIESCRTGRGVKLAVLDTGFALGHRDFAGRAVSTASFITGETAEDGHGHGTHCVGTAAGPGNPTALPRYGIAGQCDIYAGKVLSNAGRGADRGILAGMNWAIEQGCRVVSMSLGAPVSAGEKHSPVYEHVARIALARGTVIVAAAGNDSARPGAVRPVAHPANCPSILAVAAVGPDLTVAPFSNAGLNPDGGQIDIAAPGIGVLSAWPEPGGYRKLNGTSMATPHVAGVLALLAEANPASTSAELRDSLLTSARRLPSPSVDVGAGLVQAP